MSGNKLAYGTSFEDALSQLVGGETGPVAVPSPTGGKTKVTRSDLVKEAATHLKAYQKLSGQGKYAEAGREMEQLTQIIDTLLSQKGK